MELPGLDQVRLDWTWVGCDWTGLDWNLNAAFSWSQSLQEILSSFCLNLKYSILRGLLDASPLVGVIIELILNYSITCPRKPWECAINRLRWSLFTAEASWSRKCVSVYTLGLTERAFTHTWAVRRAGGGAAAAQVWAGLKWGVSLDQWAFQHAVRRQRRGDVFILALTCWSPCVLYAGLDETSLSWVSLSAPPVALHPLSLLHSCFLRNDWRFFPPVFSQTLVSWVTAMSQSWG